MAAHDLIEKFQEAGQGQVFAYFDQLDSAGQKRLLADAAEVDPVEIAALNESLLQSKGAVVDLSGLEPAPYEPLPETGAMLPHGKRLAPLENWPYEQVASPRLPLREGKALDWDTTDLRARLLSRLLNRKPCFKSLPKSCSRRANVMGNHCIGSS